MRSLILLALLALTPSQAHAESHSYINYMRSGTTTYIFIQESVEGEYGKHIATGTETGSDGRPKSFANSQFWRGYGLGTTVGVEINKFIQFVAGHTQVNDRYRDDSLQTLIGSRINVGGRLAFDSPLANLELGGGLTGAQLDYTKGLEQTSFYGSGVYYSLGLNYFLSSRVSFFYEGKLMNEHLVRQGGSANTDSIDTDMTQMGLGFRIWL